MSSPPREQTRPSRPGPEQNAFNATRTRAPPPNAQAARHAREEHERLNPKTPPVKKKTPNKGKERKTRKNRKSRKSRKNRKN
jgi:hypothetical protein